MMLKEIQQYYPAHLSSLPGKELAWLQVLRQAAFAKFLQTGLPSIREEAWRYTNLHALARQSYHFTTEAEIESPQLPPPLTTGARIVLIDGYYNAALSELSLKNTAVKIHSLAQALQQENTFLQTLWEKNLQQASALNALNMAGATDGVVIEIPENSDAGIIEICCFSTQSAERKLIQARHIIRCGANSNATVIEHYCGDSKAANFTNSVTEITLDKSATLHYIKLQKEPENAVHIGQLLVNQQQGSVLQSYLLSLGGNLVRNQLHTQLNGKQSSTELYGVFCAKKYQHMDQHTTVEHCVPETTSNEFYRGILLDSARGVFSGNVVVHPNASKTIARQTNNNLLLSPHAEIDTKPELQIYTDDVQCSHGATVGKLDEHALFYLRSRGLSAEEARSLLIYTFAVEVLKTLSDLPLRKTLQHEVYQSLPTTDWLQDICHDI